MLIPEETDFIDETLSANRSKKLQPDGRTKSKNLKMGDPRSVYESDRDKILYSSVFRRLTHVSQVLLSEDGHLLHNRQSHSQKVAQIAIDISNRLWQDAQEDPDKVKHIEDFGGLHPMAAAAGALAHDIGHPPFGHAGEKELQRLLKDVRGCSDSFEGNAQSLRNLLRYSVKDATRPLDLSLATLNAFQKYPWTKAMNDKKWGMYGLEPQDGGKTDAELASVAREYVSHLGNRRTLEAQIVDISDDISYATHDLEDFVRSGTIPLMRIKRVEPATRLREELRARALKSMHQQANSDKWMLDSGPGAVFDASHDYGADKSWQEEAVAEADEVLANLIFTFEGDGEYTPTSKNRGVLRLFGSSLVSELLGTVEVDPDFGVTLTREGHALLALLKSMTRKYVIEHPRMDLAQTGQRAIIARLFEILCNEINAKAGKVRIGLFPAYMSSAIKQANYSGTEVQKTRLVVDAIAQFTDNQAIALDRHLTGRAVAPFFIAEIA